MKVFILGLLAFSSFCKEVYSLEELEQLSDASTECPFEIVKLQGCLNIFKEKFEESLRNEIWEDADKIRVLIDEVKSYRCEIKAKCSEDTYRQYFEWLKEKFLELYENAYACAFTEKAEDRQQCFFDNVKLYMNNFASPQEEYIEGGNKRKIRETSAGQNDEEDDYDLFGSFEKNHAANGHGSHGGADAPDSLESSTTDEVPTQPSSTVEPPTGSSTAEEESTHTPSTEEPSPTDFNPNQEIVIPEGSSSSETDETWIPIEELTSEPVPTGSTNEPESSSANTEQTGEESTTEVSTLENLGGLFIGEDSEEDSTNEPPSTDSDSETTTETETTENSGTFDTNETDFPNEQSTSESVTTEEENTHEPNTSESSPTDAETTTEENTTEDLTNEVSTDSWNSEETEETTQEPFSTDSINANQPSTDATTTEEGFFTGGEFDVQDSSSTDSNSDSHSTTEATTTENVTNDLTEKETEETTEGHPSTDSIIDNQPSTESSTTDTDLITGETTSDAEEVSTEAPSTESYSIDPLDVEIQSSTNQPDESQTNSFKATNQGEIEVKEDDETTTLEAEASGNPKFPEDESTSTAAVETTNKKEEGTQTSQELPDSSSVVAETTPKSPRDVVARGSAIFELRFNGQNYVRLSNSLFVGILALVFF